MHAKLIKADFHGSIMTGQSVILRRGSRTRRGDFDFFFWGFYCMCVRGATATMLKIVRRSKNAALVGASGIVVQETENTFKVVTRKNKSKGACIVT